MQRRFAAVLVACTHVRSEDAAEAFVLFRDAIARFAAEGPTVLELDRARTLIRADTQMQQTDLASVLRMIVEGLALPDTADPRSKLEALNVIDKPQLAQLAQDVFELGSLQFLLAGDRATARRVAAEANLSSLEEVRLKL